MNRRQALLGIGFLSASSLAAFGGFKWLSWRKQPDTAFLTGQKSLVAALAETIIPATDTPGAIAAGVPDFILKMILENTDLVSQNRFIDGLKAVDPYCLSQYNVPYVRCTPEQQNAVMQHLEKQGKPFNGIVGKVQRRLIGNSFFTTLKELTCIGYCTSMRGVTEALAYIPVPGAYAACIPLTPGQKAWATD